MREGAVSVRGEGVEPFGQRTRSFRDKVPAAHTIHPFTLPLRGRVDRWSEAEAGGVG
jgi:hypothetical protein